MRKLLLLPLGFLLAVHLLQAQGGYQLFGAACTESSQNFCDLLSFAIQLTDDSLQTDITKPKIGLPHQFGLVRLSGEHELTRGVDGQIFGHTGLIAPASPHHANATSAPRFP